MPVPDQPNALVRATDPATRRFQWHTCWPANVVDAMENFLDPMHTHFIHAGLVRRDARRVPATAHFQSTREGFTVEYAGGPSQSGLLYRLFESRRTAERAHFAAPGSTRLEYVYANGSRVLIDLHFTPRTVEATDVFVSLHVEGAGRDMGRAAAGLAVPEAGQRPGRGHAEATGREQTAVRAAARRID